MIFCVEDDSSIRELMVYTLKASGYEAAGFADAASFWQELRKTRPKLVLLDIMLPDEDGLNILKKLRDSPSTGSIPVIMATAKGTEFDKVLGLDLGADDYLVKPFGMLEMVSHIRAVLRRAKPIESEQADNELVLDGLILDLRSHSTSCDGKTLELTLKEFELLKLFLENRGRAFTREDLLSLVWESNYLGETRTVDMHIASLRAKLGVYGEHIKTVRGVGYRLEEKA